MNRRDVLAGNSGPGGALLLGAGGNDTLIGGAGRDLLHNWAYRGQLYGDSKDAANDNRCAFAPAIRHTA